MGVLCNNVDVCRLRYIADSDIGFKIVTPCKGDHYEGHNYDNHNLVILLEGEVEFSYNEFINRRFKKGDMFFVPQAAQMYSTTIRDAKVLVVTFNNYFVSICEKYTMPEFSNHLQKVNYDFGPVMITETISKFANLMVRYLDDEYMCGYLQELKMKELFLIMGYEYSPRVIAELFFPIINGASDFRSRVLSNLQYGLKISDLADKFGMSYSSFLRHFKSEFGMTAQQWMLQQKSKYIRHRLSVSTVTVQDIIAEFDFTDLSHFIRFCRKQYGCTPNELKRQCDALK